MFSSQCESFREKVLQKKHCQDSTKKEREQQRGEGDKSSCGPKVMCLNIAKIPGVLRGFPQRDADSPWPGGAGPKRAKHLLGVPQNDLMLGTEIGLEGAFETATPSPVSLRH